MGKFQLLGHVGYVQSSDLERRTAMVRVYYVLPPGTELVREKLRICKCAPLLIPCVFSCTASPNGHSKRSKCRVPWTTAKETWWR